MKYKTTRSAIKWNYGPSQIFQAGYCALQIFRYQFPADAYTCGVYGWNYDVVKIGRAVVLTGYRGMFGRDLPEKVQRIINNAEKYCRAHDYDEREKYLKSAARRLVLAFDEAIG